MSSAVHLFLKYLAFYYFCGNMPLGREREKWGKGGGGHTVENHSEAKNPISKDVIHYIGTCFVIIIPMLCD